MKLHLNLATRTYVNRRQLNLFYFAVIGFLVVMLLLYGIGLVRFFRHSRELEDSLARLPAVKAESAPVDPGRSAETIARQVRFANNILKQRRFHWSAFLDRMEAVVPAGVKLRSLQPDFRAGTVKLEGVARGVPDLRNFLERLTADPALADYFLLNQAVAKEGGAKGAGLPELRFSLLVKGVF
ncbi:MAG: PilN domain-containing protein [Deltaproteobacteria bacterium]|nr:PilN domain-containing protein [Deltaproteobacteria bacterium]